ncbi:MAG: cytochrome c-type biogenesis protein CcmH [Gammaproteobacteria bacterium]|nr:cytochrome c-type biogenesis protein CcmH [Gammaproteobacteria bacterium]
MNTRAGSSVIAAIMATLLLWCPASYAIAPEQMPTPQLEARYLALIHGFRCMQCQDESLADSPVNLAADMRRDIRVMLLSGKTDQQIRDFMVSRYGYFILFKPPFVLQTAWLWLAPGAMLLIGVIVALRVIRKRAALAATDAEDNDLMDV